MQRLTWVLGLAVAFSGTFGSYAQINGIELSSVSSTNEQANWPTGGWISRDGSTVLMPSQATNLVGNDNNGINWDIYARDLAAGMTSMASVNSKNEQANAGSQFGRMSATGRYVIFETGSTNITPGVPIGYSQVYLHDRVTGQTDLVSTNSAGQPTSTSSYVGEVSPDGRFVTFYSASSNLPGGWSGSLQIYLRDRLTSETELVTVAPIGGANQGVSDLNGGSVSDDGRFVVYEVRAQNYNPVRQVVYLRDRVVGQTNHVSVPISGDWPNGDCYIPYVSGDGRYVAFASDASNLVPDDTNGVKDIFVRDMLLGQTMRVSDSSKGEQGNGPTSTGARISVNGRYLIFGSAASNLVENDVNGLSDGFVHDRWTGITEMVTLNWKGEQLDDEFHGVTAITDDGRLISMSSSSMNVIPEPVTGVKATYVRARWKLGDTNRDGVVNVIDLLALINAWGPCPAPPPPPALPVPCDADINNDGTVNVLDLLLIINNWG